ncbi:MAG: hypothetical protein ACKOET_10495, partial [Verrucomicrobiota bacterium]
AGAAAGPSTVRCGECGNWFAPADTLDFGGRTVCAGCKPVFLQRLREGAPLAEPRAPGSGPGLSAAELLAQDYDLDPLARMSDAWRLLFERPGLHWLGGFLMVVAFFAGLMASSVLQLIPFLGFMAGQALGTMATSLLLGGTGYFYARLHRGEPLELGAGFYCLGPRFGEVLRSSLPLAGLALLMGIPFLFLGATLPWIAGITGPGGPGAGTFAALGALGTVLGITYLAGLVLYLYFYVGWLYAPALVVDKGLPWREALRLSRGMVRKHPWLNLWLVIFTGLLAAAGVLACCVGWAVTLPLGYALIALQYDRMFRNLAPAPGRPTA